MEEKNGEDLMAKGHENLRVPTSEQAREYGRKGGLRSAEKRKERKRLQDIVRTMLAADSKDDPDVTVGEALVASMIENALAGDVKAFVALRDTAGDKPTERTRTEHTGGITFGWLAEPPKEEEI